MIFVNWKSFSLLKIIRFPPLILQRGCFKQSLPWRLATCKIPCLQLFLVTLYPFVLVTGLFLSWNNSSLPRLYPLMHLKTAIRSPLSFHCARWNKPAMLWLWYEAMRCCFCWHGELRLELKWSEWKTHLEQSLIALPRGLSPRAVPKDRNTLCHLWSHPL